MKDETSQIEQRVKRYWYNDGIGELIGGGLFFLLGLYFSLQQYLGDQSLVGGLLQAGFFVILIGSVFLARRLVGALKTRITYPRTGYIEYRTNTRNVILMRILSAVVAMIVAAVSIFVARKLEMIDAMVAVTGVLVAVILVVKQGWSSGVGRFYFLSAASLIFGGLLSVSEFARGYNLGIFYGLMGLAFAFSGGITLKNYLRENPLPAEVEND